MPQENKNLDKKVKKTKHLKGWLGFFLMIISIVLVSYYFVEVQRPKYIQPESYLPFFYLSILMLPLLILGLVLFILSPPRIKGSRLGPIFIFLIVTAPFILRIIFPSLLEKNFLENADKIKKEVILTGDKEKCFKIRWLPLLPQPFLNFLFVEEEILQNGKRAITLTYTLQRECVALAEKDVSLCQMIDMHHEIADCINKLVAIAKDSSICEKTNDQYWRDHCYFGMAIKNQDPHFCEMNIDFRSKDYCYEKLAILKKDPLLCEKITDDEYIHNDCLSKLSK